MENPPRTEQRDPATRDLDTAGSEGVLRMLHTADRAVLDAVEPLLPDLARLVEAAVAALRAGGSVHYFGAGTSGRLAVLDAAELRPTFTLEPGRVVAHLAGGARAVTEAVEGAEDDAAAGEADAAGLGAGDVAFGVSASGRTPYVGGALRAARRAGAVTALLANSPDPALGPLADHLLVADTGPEVLTGSTRLKAGTSAKLVLNGFSTAVMVGLGRTWSNLMVSVSATNDKLHARAGRILAEVTGLAPAEASAALRAAGGDLPTALVATLRGCGPGEAAALLAASGGSVRAAVQGPAGTATG
ncbi:N-acetylmuramic acid 6-phosphate etherase [Kineococcus sp. SYSU DK002]|uniref:N-acetylmuramic acid 6-phosphate etherase n=1 Tax=Kineococcus sp. SYSU DK002 TaxID=3383123 RepID=UPI003D7E1E8D